MKNQEIKIVVKIQYVTDISLWNAFKLRLSGGKAIKEFIDGKVELKEDKPNVPKPVVPINKLVKSKFF